MKIDSRIPVTIITGFLGAGKTTLVNKLINDYPEKKFAIIENEFGEIGIDGGLIVGANENIFELSNGCICCSLNDGFYETIAKLLDSPYPFNHLLIETTGIADPDSIIKPFLSAEEVQVNFRLDSVICMADSLNMEELIEEQDEVKKQLALADVVLLNKVDTVHPRYIAELKEIIRGVNPLATLYEAKHGQLVDCNLLDLKAFSAKKIAKVVMSFKNLSLYNGQLNHQSALVDTPGHQHHKHDIVSYGFSIPGNFDVQVFNFWIEHFLLLNRESVFRVKGFVSFEGMPEKYVFQAVRDSFMVEPAEDWGENRRFSKLVFIGKNLDRDKLEDNLYQLLYASN
jgi:G3E family GTPase